MRTMLIVLASAASLAGCGEHGLATPNVLVVEERHVTAADPAANIDSVATHPGAGGEAWLFATAKEAHIVRVYDAATGAHVRDIGGFGGGLGQFTRPNGVAALDGLLVVVERDNRRVQVLSLPRFEPLTVFGGDELELPYGAYLRRVEGDRYELFVTDAYETADEQVPPESELDRRVHRFDLRVQRAGNGEAVSVEALHARAFGETSGPGVLRVVESIWGDPDNDRLLVAEEDPAGGRVIKVYSFDGRFTGEVIGEGVFASQPEGIALYDCDDGSGYWLTTDQSEGRNVFHVFERRSLQHAGAFTGRITQNTDGVWLTRAPLDGMPDGAFFAVHDDQAVAAFDWRDIVAALNLSPCDSPAE